MDVTRKVVTLARECGARAELAAVDTESLVPAALGGGAATPQQFLDRLSEVRVGWGVSGVLCFTFCVLYCAAFKPSPPPRPPTRPPTSHPAV